MPPICISLKSVIRAVSIFYIMNTYIYGQRLELPRKQTPFPCPRPERRLSGRAQCVCNHKGKHSFIHRLLRNVGSAEREVVRGPFKHLGCIAMRRSATAVLTGALELDATPLRRVGGSAALSGEMDMAVQAALTMAGRAVMTAGMDVNVLASLIMVGAAALEGSLSLSTEAASGTFIPLLATVLLQAALTASAQFDAPTTATVEFEQSLEGSVE